MSKHVDRRFTTWTARLLTLLVVSWGLSVTARAVEREDVLKPPYGPSISGSDPKTLKGKIMTGYQGWFNCEGDGANLTWTHWAKDLTQPFQPGNIAVDQWPDVTEYDADELYDTPFKHANGSTAKVFSAHNRKTVLRHFKWMADYG
ncbi:MAG: hypothetical protein FJ220_00640, partial [Kiritimatiellaceae bacterium]|nr:hypothetical protein [Kiritimatiellaceae bacterium]